MIFFLSGKILDKRKNSLVILTPGGVGYEVGITSLQLTKFSAGQEVSLFTYLKVSDSAMSLYGFENLDEREFFELLLSISGVGPKSAMNILSLGSIDDIKSAISRGDVKYLTAVQGMGKKTAERMVVELKSKIQNTRHKTQSSEHSGILVDVMEGLMSMGYSNQEAKETVRMLDAADKTVEWLLRESLRILNK